MLITNTFNIVMAVFDVAQHVISQSAGIISGTTAIDGSSLSQMEDTLMAMDLGPLLGVFLQSIILNIAMWIMSLVIFVIIYGRMIEIYLMTSLAPIPFSTFANREQSQIGLKGCTSRSAVLKTIIKTEYWKRIKSRKSSISGTFVTSINVLFFNCMAQTWLTFLANFLNRFFNYGSLG